MKHTIFILSLLLLGCNSNTGERSQEAPLYDYDVEERLTEMGITLIDPSLPKHIKIALARRAGNLIFLSGNGPINPDGTRVVGKVGSDLTLEEGYDAAKLTAIRHLAVLKQELGDLNKVEQFIKVLGMVNADSSFTDHPRVINGYSELMAAVFEERGIHARSAVGMGSLPWNMACEVEAIVLVRD
jgi:enamine deaminase RidA (YjgF/YER057c/UK114 family)